MIGLCLLTAYFVCLPSVPADTNDYTLSFLAGALTGFGEKGHTYSWSFSYMEGWNERWAWSISKINEGHDDGHHRDGTALQLWTRTRVSQDRLTVALGLGPHFFYDTVDSSIYEQGYENDHGAGIVASAMVRWRATDLWLLEVRGNGTLNADGDNTAALLLGAGCSLEPSWTGSRPANVRQNEITFLGGANIINSFGSETGEALSVEYRRYLLPWLGATCTLLYEDGSDMVNRRGVSPQLWLGRHFADGRLSLGVGTGPYFAFDSYRKNQPQLSKEFCVPALASFTAAYHFDSGFLLRATWHRVSTSYDYNRDADVILLGLGRGF